MQIVINPDGTVETIDGAELLEGIGPVELERASHIEPVNRILRWAFHVIRSRTGDDSRIAAWTRRWRCRWQVAIVGGPVWGAYTNRERAIAAEVAWLNRNRFGGTNGREVTPGADHDQD
jgi:hypothetical protein